MSYPTHSAPDHLTDLPIVDFLAHDPQLRAYVAEFVPDPRVSPAAKESVLISNDSPTARHLRELLEVLAEQLSVASPITRLAHGGGDSFDLHLADGASLSLPDSLPPDQTVNIHAILHVLAQEIQLEYIVQSRPPNQRAAG